MNKNRKECFVFVVCGAKEHINTLNYSLQFLKHFSQKEIIIVTDLKRNEIAIEHNQIIDITTNSSFDNHQASIYLKTNLHQILPLENHLYCYLDTDVIAVSEQVDEIFGQFRSPIIFCTDHCKMMYFSPSAVYDLRYDEIAAKQQRLYKLYDDFYLEAVKNEEIPVEHLKNFKKIKEGFNRNRPFYDQSISRILYAEAGIKKIVKLFKVLVARILFHLIAKPTLLSSLFSGLFFSFQKKMKGTFFQKWKKQSSIFYNKRLEYLHRRIYKAPFKFSNFVREFHYEYDEKEYKWYDLEKNLLYEENLIIKRVEEASEFRWDFKRGIWLDAKGNSLKFKPGSDKLRQLIKKKFDLHITETNWQHWNGGVFLFNKESSDFLEQWHQWTMAIFQDPQWKTRDQGTLIATAWKFGLQNHPTLAIVYNFIADYFHQSMQYKGNFIFDLDKERTNIQPHFLHIYHHFGDRSWELWQDIEKLGEIHNIVFTV